MTPPSSRTVADCTTLLWISLVCVWSLERCFLENKPSWLTSCPNYGYSHIRGEDSNISTSCCGCTAPGLSLPTPLYKEWHRGLYPELGGKTTLLRQPLRYTPLHMSHKCWINAGFWAFECVLPYQYKLCVFCDFHSLFAISFYAINQAFCLFHCNLSILSYFLSS